ncbi:S1C family serine protease [Thermomonospora cellulosilytica]|uniref:Putative serine protease PepD n=1 Tax=Thermomonospora cellulosilytica TaxID=1411118 RepID=A0A7W3MWC4_9ACTN|nr:trypsin-like peptidase domain-containing protein [Thermomonospora cellulosilytica]MBA9003117.1 putative serine protease PepD [Thermomonospora cellulosilytica]
MNPGGPYGWTPGHGAGGRSGWGLRRKLLVAGAGVLIALGAGGVGAVGAVSLVDGGASAPGVAGVPAAASKGSAARIAAAVQPSVVSISAEVDGGTSGGSGVILRPDGTILTNAHVVEGASQVRVRFSDGRTAAADVLGTGDSQDVAVIRARGVSGLKAASIGDSDSLVVGDPVLAVGSPLGLDGSVTSGIVSALGRTVQESRNRPDVPPGLGQGVRREAATTIENAIQTDAAINPGNSGGPLVNAAGQVIGITTAIATAGQGGGSIGVGFAIPVNDAMKVANRLLA